MKRTILTLALFALSTAQAERTWILQAYLYRAGVAFSSPVDDHYFEAGSVALGRKVASHVWVAGGVKVGENWWHSFNNPEASYMPVYGYVLYTPSAPHPGSLITYGFAGLCFGSIAHVRAGLGACTTIWALTPGIELSWRREEPFRRHYYKPTDFWSAAVTLGIGGWWTIGR